jgi:uncharacterized phage-associated protein
MPTVFDVNTYLQSRLGITGDIKRHKLLYAINRLCLFKTGEPMFPSEAVGWKWGPAYEGIYYNPARRGNPDALSAEHISFVAEVNQKLGRAGGQALAKRSHGRYPEWRDAREGLKPNDNGHNLITFEAMRRALAGELATVIDGQVCLRVRSNSYADIEAALTSLRRITKGRLEFLAV